MKVTDSFATENKTAVQIDLELDTVPVEAHEEVKRKIGEFLLEQTLLTVGEAKSPVAGEAWPALSSEYKAEKKSEGGSGKADLELSGSMLDHLDFKVTDKGIEIGIYGKDAPKADGHNNLSGDSELAALGKQRRFLPDVGQEYKATIQKEAEKIIADAVASETQIKRQDLEAISSAAELYEFLGELFGGLSRSEIRGAVLRSPALFDLLAEEDLIGFL